MVYKSGWKTSECINTIVINIVFILSIFGIAKKQNMDNLTTTLNDGIMGLIMCLNSCFYIWSRMKIKINYLQSLDKKKPTSRKRITKKPTIRKTITKK